MTRLMTFCCLRWTSNLKLEVFDNKPRVSNNPKLALTDIAACTRPTRRTMYIDANKTLRMHAHQKRWHWLILLIVLI